MPKINVEPSSTCTQTQGRKLEETASLSKCIMTHIKHHEPMTPPAAVHVEGTRHQSTHRLLLQPGRRSVSADPILNTEHPKRRNPNAAFTCHQSPSIFYIQFILILVFYSSLIVETQLRTVSTLVCVCLC